MKNAIEVSHLHKKYRRGQNSAYISLRDTVMDWLNHPVSNWRQRLQTDEFWALRNISFKVEPGEAVGIIGGNGAGKSTLLKVLSRITPPTKGEAAIRGRLASLLEVGTGFHPELTARENIFLNGAILGMRHREIRQNLNRILEFAEVEKFVDTPVKHFSSGMYTRLAFAVAAHLDSEILLVDEVLAVGDISFQRRCLGKMSEVVADQGRTILFVSHNLGAVQNLCSRCLWIDRGRVIDFDQTDKVIKSYLTKHSVGQARMQFKQDKLKPAQIRKISIINKNNVATTDLEVLEPFRITIDYEIRRKLEGSHVAIAVTDSKDNYLLFSSTLDYQRDMLHSQKPGRYQAIYTYITNGSQNLNQGTYFIRITIGVPDGTTYDEVRNIKIVLHDHAKHHELLRNGSRPGIFISTQRWKNNFIKD